MSGNQYPNGATGGDLIVGFLSRFFTRVSSMVHRPALIEPYIFLEFEERQPRETTGKALREALRLSTLVAVNREFEAMMGWPPNTKAGNALCSFPQAEQFITEGVPDGPITLGEDDGQVIEIAGFRVHWRYHEDRRHVIYYITPRRPIFSLLSKLNSFGLTQQ